ncbi:hypothetical protein BJ170DRAFT_697469 [Xylariales sp. AK1849]|nr:hypothetical protein BJ170DRAFT_697469 [Xylariales sp. AK1849]
MKFLVGLTWATALSPSVAFASWLGRRGSSSRCGFTISSSGSFVCPAGQLADGQIRLNGSEAISTFYIDANGGITDVNGFGCTITDKPTTQFQCDKGASPMDGFSIDASNNLMYEGSGTFWACPATNTEYNVYVDPNFGQTKCFQISLKASACSSPSSSSCTGSLSTVWATQTDTITQDVTQTITVMVTSTAVCSSSSASVSFWNSTTTSAICHKCTESSSYPNSTWSDPLPTLSTSAAVDRRSSVPADAGEVGYLEVRPRSLHQLSKRALYDDWNYVQTHYTTDTGTYKWVPIGQVNTFPLTIGQQQWMGTAFYYGCTILVVAGVDKVIFGHIRQIMSDGGESGCPLETRDQTEDLMIPYITNQLTNAGVDSLADVSPVCNQRYAWIMGSVPDSSYNSGPARLKEWMVEQGIPAQNVHYNFYKAGQGDFGTAPSGPGGKGLIKWDSPAGSTNNPLSVLTVFLSSETPRIVLNYQNSDNTLIFENMDTSISPLTTDGTKVYADAPSGDDTKV